ncbi:sodium:proton antiporter, partial [Leptospira borgpetersenii]
MKQKLTSVLLATLLTLPTATLLADEPVGNTQNTVQTQDSSHTQENSSGNHEEGEDLPYWSVIPFVLILLCIALLPIVSQTTSHWWESNTNKLILALALAAVSFLILVLHGWFGKIVHTLVFEYVPFIILLGALFYISGGIRLKGDIEATPLNNTIFLIIGTFLASFIGTTGAS